MPTIEDAILLATNAHRGQTDKAGLPYITHPLRVMSMFVLPEEDDERIVAVLHDVVEDTDYNLDQLLFRNYSRAVVDAVDAISRRADESYSNYIERVAKNPLALKVKLADLTDNLDTRRKSTGMIGGRSIDKYIAAKERLQDVLNSGPALLGRETSWRDKHKATFSGKPPAEGMEFAGAPQPIDPNTGMHKDYYVLPEADRKNGWVRPLRTSYVHSKCGVMTTMGLALSETYARDPKYYGATFCANCKEHFPVGQFKWSQDGEVVGS